MCAINSVDQTKDGYVWHLHKNIISRRSDAARYNNDKAAFTKSQKQFKYAAPFSEIHVHIQVYTPWNKTFCWQCCYLVKILKCFILASVI